MVLIIRLFTEMVCAGSSYHMFSQMMTEPTLVLLSIFLVLTQRALSSVLQVRRSNFSSSSAAATATTIDATSVMAQGDDNNSLTLVNVDMTLTLISGFL